MTGPRLTEWLLRAVGQAPDVADREDGGMIVVCAWCGLSRVGGVWRALAPVRDARRTSHGICPRCFAAVHGEGTS